MIFSKSESAWKMVFPSVVFSLMIFFNPWFAITDYLFVCIGIWLFVFGGLIYLAKGFQQEVEIKEEEIDVRFYVFKKQIVRRNFTKESLQEMVVTFDKYFRSLLVIKTKKREGFKFNKFAGNIEFQNQMIDFFERNQIHILYFNKKNQR